MQATHFFFVFVFVLRISLSGKYCLHSSSLTGLIHVYELIMCSSCYGFTVVTCHSHHFHYYRNALPTHLTVLMLTVSSLNIDESQWLHFFCMKEFNDYKSAFMSDAILPDCHWQTKKTKKNKTIIGYWLEGSTIFLALTSASDIIGQNHKIWGIIFRAIFRWTWHAGSYSLLAKKHSQ